MQTCPRCGQVDIDESHRCAPTTTAVDQGTGVRSAVVALVILVLSFGLFVATLAFTVLHQQASAAPVIIQTTLPTNDATATSTGQDITPPASIAPTATPAKHSGSNGSAQPTPLPKAPPPTTPPLPTTVPPTPTPTDMPPQPTPTRVPQ